MMGCRVQLGQSRGQRIQLGFVPVVPSPEPVSLAISLAVSAVSAIVPKLIGTFGKSEAQKAAEYELSAVANEIEKALDINSMAFRGGYLARATALYNYDYLWSLLVQASQAAMAITPAQATRLLADRDYGGQFANIWRGVFRDDRILGVGGECLENDFVIPACQWDIDLGQLKYGAEGTTLIPLPSPTTVTTPAGSGAPIDSLTRLLPRTAAGEINWAAILPLALGGFLLYKAV